MSKQCILMGLIGANIMGSLSPALFAGAFEAAGIDGFYDLMDVDRLPGRPLPQLLDAIKAAGFAGANITYSFKQGIIPLIDAVDPTAMQTGAINTVLITPDGHRGRRHRSRPNTCSGRAAQHSRRAATSGMRSSACATM
jgi:shikimate dehydrogenase